MITVEKLKTLSREARSLSEDNEIYWVFIGVIVKGLEERRVLTDLSVKLWMSAREADRSVTDELLGQVENALSELDDCTVKTKPEIK